MELKEIKKDLMMYAKYRYLDSFENKTEKREKSRKDIGRYFKSKYGIRLFESNRRDVYKVILEGSHNKGENSPKDCNECKVSPCMCMELEGHE